MRLVSRLQQGGADLGVHGRTDWLAAPCTSCSLRFAMLSDTDTSMPV